jgi:hypothetical protein
MIIKRAANVFQWLVLVVPDIPIRYEKGHSIEDIQKWLQKRPTKLSSLYQDILTHIDEESFSQSLQLMQWICFARRPLTLGELRYAMAIHADLPDRALKITNYAETDEKMEQKAKSLSGGLAEVNKHEYVFMVQFIHQSVKDYLIESGLEELETSLWTRGFPCQVPGFWMLAKLLWRLVYKTMMTTSVTGRAHFRLSRACIRYIAKEEWLTRSMFNTQGLVAQEVPFLFYAERSWISHTELVEAEGISQEDLLSMLHESSNWILPYHYRIPYSLGLCHPPPPSHDPPPCCSKAWSFEFSDGIHRIREIFRRRAARSRKCSRSDTIILRG